MCEEEKIESKTEEIIKSIKQHLFFLEDKLKPFSVDLIVTPSTPTNENEAHTQSKFLSDLKNIEQILKRIDKNLMV